MVPSIYFIVFGCITMAAHENIPDVDVHLLGQSSMNMIATSSAPKSTRTLP